jgi:tetratricopeptide (TPR) repeat protein
MLITQSYREAAALYGRVADLAPSAAAAHHQHGLALARAGNTTSALAAYGRAVALDGSLAVSLNNIGVLLSGMGRLDEALEYYSRAHAADPGYKDAGDNVAAVLRAGAHYRDLVAHHREPARALEADAPAGPGQVTSAAAAAAVS